ncbi:hypothetical protein AnigIFM60653_008564 [Aspergillus niger]|nr:hypothetical protein AnigIFM60653_008564 [Aspergillus niger]
MGLCMSLMGRNRRRYPSMDHTVLLVVALVVGEEEGLGRLVAEGDLAGDEEGDGRFEDKLRLA